MLLSKSYHIYALSKDGNCVIEILAIRELDASSREYEVSLEHLYGEFFTSVIGEKAEGAADILIVKGYIFQVRLKTIILLSSFLDCGE